MRLYNRRMTRNFLGQLQQKKERPRREKFLVFSRGKLKKKL